MINNHNPNIIKEGSALSGQKQTPGRPAKRNWRHCSILAVVGLAAAAYALPVRSQAQTVVSFDVPGSISTQVGGISPAGTTTGTYTDSNTNSHGFLRTSDGEFITFDEPGATTNIFYNSAGVNPAGEIAGNYGLFAGEFSLFGGPLEPFYFTTAFLRLPDGAIFDIDPVGAYESQAYAINEQGTVAGTYGLASDGSNHYFVLTAKGIYTTFDPEAGDTPEVIAINPEGATTGWYFDATFNVHSFVRTAQGEIASFDAPDGVNGTAAAGINSSGAITGSYVDTNYVGHGFLLSNRGQFTAFDPEGSVNTTPVAIAPSGVIAGYYDDTNYIGHGFVRARNGDITTFDPEGSTGTMVSGINSGGAVTGSYYDTNGVSHGFVFQTDAE